MTPINKLGATTVAQAARDLETDPSLIRLWLAQGRLKGRKFGRDWLVTLPYKLTLSEHGPRPRAADILGLGRET